MLVLFVREILLISVRKREWRIREDMNYTYMYLLDK